VREIRTLRAMWRALETGSRQVLNGHEGGNPGHKPRMSLRATAPVLDPTSYDRSEQSEQLACLLTWDACGAIYDAASAASTAAKVSGLTFPLASKRCDSWNFLTAIAVCGP
jgi:hypothetical protein